MSWAIETSTGRAASFHARELPDPPERAVWIFNVDTPALVLGSTQPIEVIDVDECERAGIEVVRRRSGGGAVLLDPQDAIWIDFVLPRDDPLWDDDIARAALWVGRAWRNAVVLAGAPADAVTVHEGGLLKGAWSDRVCFAGRGPGELVVGGAKLVGVSQRRTRAGARFQCVALRRWRPERLIGLLSPPRPTIEDVASLATDTAELHLDPALVIDALLAYLSSGEPEAPDS